MEALAEENADESEKYTPKKKKNEQRGRGVALTLRGGGTIVLEQGGTYLKGEEERLARGGVERRYAWMIWREVEKYGGSKVDLGKILMQTGAERLWG